MSNKKQNRFKINNLPKAELMAVLFMVLFVGLVMAGAFWAGVDEVLAEFKKINILVVPLLLILSFTNFFLRGLKWHLFADKLEMKVPFKRMMLYYFAGMSMIVTPGKLGTGLRLWFLSKCHKISYSRSVPLMVMDPITDLGALFLICLVGGISFSGFGNLIAVFGVVLVIAILLIAKPVFLEKVIRIVYARLGKKQIRLFATLQKVLHNMTSLVSPKVFGKTIIFSLLAWMSSITAFWIILEALSADGISYVSYGQAMFIFSFATILGGAVMLPGGLGGTDGAIFGLLIMLDVPSDTALAATVIIRLLTLWFAVLIGFIMLPCGLSLAKLGEVKKLKNENI